jgi:hypothetical protein
MNGGSTIRWLLGLDAASVEGTDARWSLGLNSVPEGPWAVAAIVAAILAIALVWYLYRAEGRDISRLGRLLLATLRLSILALVAVMLLELVLVQTITEYLPSRLLVLVDTSESMALEDPYTAEPSARETAERLGLKNSAGEPDLESLRKLKRLELARKALEPLWPDLKDGRLISAYGFATALEPVAAVADLAKLRASGAATSVGDAVTAALAAHRGQPVAGLVLVTDGRSNTGNDPLQAGKQAAQDAVPIYALAVGTTEGPRNVRLAEVEASPAVFVRDTAEIGVLVESRGLKGQTATVSLERRSGDGPWTEVGSNDVLLGEDSTLQRIPFTFVPETTGQVEFRARVFDAGPELTDADNVAHANVKVVRQKIRVLLLAGFPSSEFQFLRAALLRDEKIEFASWLQSADDKYEHQGHRPIRRLPANQEELNYFDVLILADPDPRRFAPEWSDMITRFVGDAGGGLIYVAGELQSKSLFNPALADGAGPAPSDTSWTKVLPVVVDPGLYQSTAEVQLSSRDTWTLELTPAGLSDAVFRFDADNSKNRDILTSLPGMYWHFPVTRAKPGATVLARHGDPRMQNNFGRHVLIAMQLYGPGRTVFVGCDSTYRWRYLHEEYFDGFWARLVDRVGRSKVLGGRFPFTLATDKTTYRVGDRVNLRAQFIEATDMASSLGSLTGEVEVGDQTPLSITLDPAPGDASAFEASFPAASAGAYTVRVVPAIQGEMEGGPRAATLNFRVEPPRQELDQPSLDRGLLDALARESKGAAFSLADARDLPGAIKIRQVTRTLELRNEIWDAPLLFGGVMLLLTIEWVLRKIYRMA